MGYRTRYGCTYCDFLTTNPERIARHLRESGHPGYVEAVVPRTKNRSGAAKRRARREREQQSHQKVADQRQAALDLKLANALRKKRR